MEVLRKRAAALYQEDRSKTLRKSHENPYIQALYADYLGEPCGPRAHKLLHTHYFDRKEAITYAIEHGEPGDIIVLAGKGHEDYQEIKGVKHPMDERVLFRDILAEGHIPGSAAGQGL